MTTDQIKEALAAPTVPVPVIAGVLGISRNLAYRGVKSGEIESITVGRSIRVPTAPYRRKLGLDQDATAKDAA